jgi:N-methylhydantoinase A
LIRDGQPVLKPDYKLEWSRLHPGYPVQVPVVDIVEIGAGGGSIAWTDTQGAFRVGPHSAGADPGPACYGLGGTQPTVTDAKLLTGVLDPDRFAGGRMELDMALAACAMRPLAEHLRCSIADAACAVIRLVEANMINALKLVTVQRGHDPRELTLVASGGGGPMHAAALGRELGVRRTVIPRYAGLFSAWGMLAARPRLDLRRTQFMSVSPGTAEAVRGVFAELRQEATAHFIGTPATALSFTAAIDMRYAGQEHSVAVAIDPAWLTVADLLAAFHSAHRRAYTFALPDTQAELVTFHLAVELDAPRVGLPLLAPGGSVADARRGERPVLFSGERAPVRATVYERDALPPCAELPGPALVEEATSTTLILPAQLLRVDPHGLLVIEKAG